MVTNPVGTWTDPDFNTQTGTALKTNYDNAHAVAKRGADSFAPHESNPPAMTVEVDAGHRWNGVGMVEVAAQTSATLVAPTTLPRIDRLVRDRLTGTISVIGGVEASSPVPPAIPGGTIPIAQIGPLQTSTSTIQNALISDERPYERESLIAARGDLLVGDANGDPSALAVGAAGQAVISDGTDPAYAEIPYPPTFISGFNTRSNATDPDFDADITKGKARDEVDSANIVLASALVKQMDAAWEVGTNKGAWVGPIINPSSTVTFADVGGADTVTIDSGTWAVTPGQGDLLIITGGTNAGAASVDLVPTSTVITTSSLFPWVNEAASTATLRFVPKGWNYLHTAKRTDTGVVDAFLSESVSAPTLPAGYSKSRRIAAVLLDGVPPVFQHYFSWGDYFWWQIAKDGGNDFITSTTELVAKTIPPLPVIWLGSASVEETAAAIVLLSSPLNPDVAPSSSNHTLWLDGTNDLRQQVEMEIYTEDQTIRTRSTIVTEGYFKTRGWVDRRGKEGDA